ncbi:MAG: nuclear transport factor 2 family protein [Pyrinomonadaceae bacterium]
MICKLFLVKVVVIVLVCAFSAVGQMDDNAAVRIPLENYLKAHATGDPEYARKAFHSEGNLIWIRDRKFSSRSFAEYISGFTGKPSADEADRKRKIEAVDVTGNAAVAKIVLDYPTVKFVDYMTLLKIDGEWKIVSKAFYAEPKRPAPDVKKP